MSDADIPLGLRLSRQAGWNQLEADWRRMRDLEPEGGLVAEWDSVPVGTTIAVTFGPIAWIAMVLVDEAYRGRGVARRLMSTALEWLDERGVATVRLDATPLGQPVYERLGFRPQFELQRWDGTCRPIGTGSAIPRSADPKSALRIDADVTHTDRHKLLQRLFADDPTHLRSGEHGYGTWRRGALADFGGPCLADADTGPVLLRELLRDRAGRRVFLDIPRANPAAEELAHEHGLQPVRVLTRMVRGTEVHEDLARFWASSGPELG
jgi:GNAT superfamily N-acetyltransferase